MSGAILAVLATGKAPNLTVSLSSGPHIAYHVNSGMSSHDFGANSATPSGGSGSYTYAWTETDDGEGVWGITGQTMATADISVTSMFAGLSQATATCTVTDTVTGHTGSATCVYTFSNNL